MTGAVDNPARAASSEPREKLLRSLPARIARWASASVGFVAALLGVIVVLVPSVVPKGESGTRGASLTDVTAVDLGYGQYLDRIGQSRRPYDAAALRERGVLVRYNASAEGYKDKKLTIRAQLIDVGTQEQITASDAWSLEPQAAVKDDGNLPIWLPLEAGLGGTLVHVEMELSYGHGELPIKRAESPQFRLREAS
jgi:hypothetical protein